jgi:hypothetical protein
MKLLLTVASAALMLSSCSEFNKRRNNQTWATGKPGEVLVVCTDDLWLSNNLDSFLQQLAPPEEPYYPLEYAFRFHQKNVSGFNSTFRSTRNILIIEQHNNAKYSPAKINILHDKWVKGQVVVEVFFQDIRDLHALTSAEICKITDAFEEGEINRLVKHFTTKKNNAVQAVIRDKYGVELSLPVGVEIVNNKDDFLRIDIPERSREMPLDGGKVQTSKVNFIMSYVLMWQREYSDETFFSRAELLKYQDSILKKYAPHEKEGAYLATEYDSLVHPISRTFDLNGTPLIEIKGQYRIRGRSDVFMGGPFVSYSFVNPKTNNIVTIFGMVHGPSEPLLNYIREHKALIRTLKI